MPSGTHALSFEARKAAARGLGLRPATSADASFLTDLFAAVRGAEFAPLGWPEPMLRALLAQQEQFQDRQYRATHPNALWLIVERCGVPVGRLGIAEYKGAIRLIDIAFLPKECGSGNGTALLGDLLALAAETGRPVTLSVPQGNPARRLYERVGFVLCPDGGAYDEMRWTPRSAESGALSDPE